MTSLIAFKFWSEP